MKEVISFLSKFGFTGTPILDGKVQRFKVDKKDAKMSGWYCGFQNFSNSGQKFFVVRAGNFKTQEIEQYQSDGVQLDKFDRENIKKQIAEATKKAEDERAAVAEQVSKDSATEFDKMETAQLSDYHVRKGLTDLHGARTFVDQYGRHAVVPMRDIDGKLWSYQKIQPDGGKFYKSGGKKQGTFHAIGDLLKSDLILICEGFATGASIFEATKVPTVCTFDSGNLPIVAGILKERFPEKSFKVCGDDDIFKFKPDGSPLNSGREKALEAASRCLGTAIFPKFADLATRPTDFNDLANLEGLQEVERQITAVKTQKAAVIPLGFRGEEYFFTSTDNPTITILSSFSETECFKLMRKAYWEQVYPNAKGGIDWSQAKSKLMEACRAKGIFEARHVRGSGIWRDDGRVVVNMGDRLLVGEKEMPVNHIKSRYFYTLGRALPEVKSTKLSVKECDLLIEICDLFKWRQPEYGNYVAGMLVVSKLCGALPIRPHMWITGGSQTGKSTLLENLIYPTLKDYSIYFQGGTSEAGLRQSLLSDSVPIIFDEFETNGKRSSEHIQSCIELMRSAWSETHGYIAKGSAGGSANYYQPRFSAIVSSIRPNLINDADRSRFAVVELRPHGNDTEHWKKLSGLLSKYDREYIDRLFLRSLDMLPIIIQNYDLLRKALSQKVSARFGQQYGMLLAGYASLTSDEVLTPPEIDVLIANLGLESERAEAKLQDEEECLNFLMSKRVTHVNLQGLREDLTIGELIVKSQRDSEASLTLKRIGVLIESDGICIANSHAELKQLFNNPAGEKWMNCWATTLARLPGSQKTNAKYFGGFKQRTVKIPSALLEK